MIPSNYVDQYINVPVDMRVCRYWDEKRNDMIFTRINQLDENTIQNRIVMYPTGLKDAEDIMLYSGDLIEVEIEAKELTFIRRGIIKKEGLYAVGIDYLDKDLNLTDDGDFIDEFYISSMRKIGDVFSGLYPGYNIDVYKNIDI